MGQLGFRPTGLMVTVMKDAPSINRLRGGHDGIAQKCVYVCVVFPGLEIGG